MVVFKDVSDRDSHGSIRLRTFIKLCCQTAREIK